MRNDCLKLLSRFVGSAAITLSLVATGALSAEAKDDKRKDDGKGPGALQNKCRVDPGNSRADPKVWPYITSVEVKQDQPHPLAGGEIVEVTVKGNFPGRTGFVFGGWENPVGEASSFDAFDVIKQDLHDPTFRATIRVPKVGNRTYGSLDVTMLTSAPTCRDSYHVQLKPPKTVGSTSQRPSAQALGIAVRE